MARRPRRESPSHTRPDAAWVITTDLRVNGRTVTPGTEVKISSAPGRYIFRRHVLNPANSAEWIDVFGGPKGAECVRSFRPERIATVHRLKKTRSNS